MGSLDDLPNGGDNVRHIRVGHRGEERQCDQLLEGRLGIRALAGPGAQALPVVGVRVDLPIMHAY